MVASATNRKQRISVRETLHEARDRIQRDTGNMTAEHDGFLVSQCKDNGLWYVCNRRGEINGPFASSPGEATIMFKKEQVRSRYC